MTPGGAPSWSFGPADSKKIEEVLDTLLYESNARCALLVDRTGQLVVTVGEQPDFDSAAFASLTAADFSANDQLASLIGEEEFSSLFHQGRSESMYLADVGKRLILVVLFNKQTTLGLVRIKIRNAVSDLNKAFEEVFGRERGEARPLERDFVNEAEDEIDRLFRE
ncbi:MAG: roadblock/LC7 domain-containing protein [Gemmatimonadota bacterium]|nr:MAG: roadblock/LC7 domain-containing protein [Gemmatimonadota bacterium]